MTVAAMVLIFLSCFLTINIVMSNLGLFPKIARAFNVKGKKDVLNYSRIKSLEFSRESTFKSETNEYRGWLKIAFLVEGLYIVQRPILNFFPRKFLIPWSEINYVLTSEGVFSKRYIYSVKVNNEVIFIISKSDIVKERNDALGT